MRTRRSWLLAATSLRPLAGLLAIGVFSAACGPSNPGRIDDNAVYFNCLEQFVERLRQSTCRVDVDSGSIEEVYAESIITWGPSVSPDRRHIVLTADPDPGSFDDPSEFVVLDAEHLVTRTFATNGSINRSWSPTSDAFLTTTDTGLAIIPLDGSAPERIDVSPPAQPGEHAMSPDGSLIAAAIGGMDEPTFLVVYDVTSGLEESRIETGPISSLAWSSDGRLAIGSSSGLLLLDPETNDFSVLDISALDRYFGVSWSPGDDHIAAMRGGSAGAVRHRARNPTAVDAEECERGEWTTRLVTEWRTDRRCTRQRGRPAPATGAGRRRTRHPHRFDSRGRTTR